MYWRSRNYLGAHCLASFLLVSACASAVSDSNVQSASNGQKKLDTLFASASLGAYVLPNSFVSAAPLYGEAITSFDNARPTLSKNESNTLRQEKEQLITSVENCLASIREIANIHKNIGLSGDSDEMQIGKTACNSTNNSIRKSK